LIVEKHNYLFDINTEVIENYLALGIDQDPPQGREPLRMTTGTPALKAFQKQSFLLLPSQREAVFFTVAVDPVIDTQFRRPASSDTLAGRRRLSRYRLSYYQAA